MPTMEMEKRIKNMEKNIEYLGQQLESCNAMIQASAKALNTLNKRIGEISFNFELEIKK